MLQLTTIQVRSHIFIFPSTNEIMRVHKYTTHHHVMIYDYEAVMNNVEKKNE